MATQARNVGSVNDIQAKLRNARPDTTANEYMQALAAGVQQTDLPHKRQNFFRALSVSLVGTAGIRTYDFHRVKVMREWPDDHSKGVINRMSRQKNRPSGRCLLPKCYQSGRRADRGGSALFTGQK